MTYPKYYDGTENVELGKDDLTQVTPESIGASPDTHTHTDLHTHTNKTVLDDLSDSGGTLLYNGQEISGSPDNLTSTELTLGNYKISYNSTEDSLDFEVIV